MKAVQLLCSTASLSACHRRTGSGIPPCSPRHTHHATLGMHYHTQTSNSAHMHVCLRCLGDGLHIRLMPRCWLVAGQLASSRTNCRVHCMHHLCMQRG
jgi:hypothetical protein